MSRSPPQLGTWRFCSLLLVCVTVCPAHLWWWLRPCQPVIEGFSVTHSWTGCGQCWREVSSPGNDSELANILRETSNGVSYKTEGGFQLFVFLSSRYTENRECCFCSPPKYSTVVGLKKKLSSHGVSKIKNKCGKKCCYWKDCQTHPEDLEAHLQRLPSDTMFVPTLTSPPPPLLPLPASIFQKTWMIL